MEGYSNYRNSKIQWIGKIPAHWEERKAKYIFSYKKMIVGEKADNYDLLSLTLKGIIRRDMENPTGKFPSSFDSYQEVNKGDFVFCLFDNEETPRTVGLSEFYGMITGAYDVFGCNKPGILPQFLLYYYLTIDDSKLMRPLYKGLRKTIPFDSFMRYRIPLPPLSEQEKIVSYLDSKTSIINSYVAERERELWLLNELKETEIANVVTQGLNPNVKMKDSGIPWIGMIPEHWDLKRAKYMFVKNKRARRPDDDVITCFRDGQVTLRKNRRLTGFTESEKYDGYQGIRKGDLVIHQMDAFAGAIGVSDSDGMGSSVYHCCTPTGDYNVYYYAYLIRQMAMSGFIQSLYKGIRERSSDFSFPIFGNQYLAIPPRKEQDAIVAYIDNKCVKVNTLIAELEAEIDYLKEYKQRLIADCVTGQVKV